MKPYNVFILGYNAAWFLDDWLEPDEFPNTNFRIIDNGQQIYPERFNPILTYTTSQNIGCAGGWNLICKIGFEHLGLDKIVISNEDNLYTEDYISELYKLCNPTNIAGTYGNGFEFSLFCLHRDTYNKIGRFDENFLRGCCEDDDYKYRAKLLGITTSCLGISSQFNYNLAAGDKIPEFQKKNIAYLKKKWGDKTYITPFDNLYEDFLIQDNLIEEFGEELIDYPSVDEYKKFTMK